MRALVLALLLCGVSCAQPRPPVVKAKPAPAAAAAVASLTGAWTWKQGAESFDLKLTQDGDHITGTHAAVGQRGAKVDEAVNDEASIEGTRQGAVATVTFRSAYPDAKGHGVATLTLRNGSLYWQIVKAEGEHYFPKTARLSRAKQ